MFQKFLRRFVKIIFLVAPRHKIVVLEPYQKMDVQTAVGICKIDNISMHYLAIQICE